MLPIILSHWVTYVYLLWVLVIFVVLLVQMIARLPRGASPARWSVAPRLH